MNLASSLPDPDPRAKHNSFKLQQLIANEISNANGWINFERYMQLCLYQPRLGYYSGPSNKFGPEGDFVTAPQLSPLFGACVAAQCAQWLDQLGADEIIEFGAGDGLLAAQILNEFSRQKRRVRYQIIELSADLQERQRTTIRALAPHAAEQVQWHSQLPSNVVGIILANELLDAMPVRIFSVTSDGTAMERGVQVSPTHTSTNELRFEWADRNASNEFDEQVRQRLLAAGHDQPPKNYLSEIAPQVSGWIRSAAQSLKHGAILLFDYGFGAGEYYHAQRSMGTLQCHYRHHSHGDPFFWPGLQDITAHVDFTSVHEAAIASELELLGYTTQSHFLMNAGLLQMLEQMKADPQYPRYAQAVGRLISEAEMGELFKAIAFAKIPAGSPFDSRAFSLARASDRSGSL